MVPLSTKSGLLEWVPKCDTLHQLIKGYRKKRNIQLAVEHSLMKAMCPMYGNVSLLQKVEVLRYALENTSGQDLRRVRRLRRERAVYGKLASAHPYYPY